MHLCVMPSEVSRHNSTCTSLYFSLFWLSVTDLMLRCEQNKELRFASNPRLPFPVTTVSFAAPLRFMFLIFSHHRSNQDWAVVKDCVRLTPHNRFYDIVVR
ncbi:hypothetical protein KIN20_007918 [Parelaphostrongylus tenuis]|uniref:Uncharacterized protein n=1 Tax=Parelaphostrongylus tenuis TaxID=148309 RepID=A0AAD5M423_PARTN|nr:hypothetical protein KIN20_007918 [Parelaphostrongylus tenuis]